MLYVKWSPLSFTMYGTSTFFWHTDKLWILWFLKLVTNICLLYWKQLFNFHHKLNAIKITATIQEITCYYIGRHVVTIIKMDQGEVPNMSEVQWHHNKRIDEVPEERKLEGKRWTKLNSEMVAHLTKVERMAQLFCNRQQNSLHMPTSWPINTLLYSTNNNIHTNTYTCKGNDYLMNCNMIM